MYYIVLVDENGEKFIDSFEDFLCAVDDFVFYLEHGKWARVCLCAGSVCDPVCIA